MEDLGEPIAYLTLARGTPVYSAAGERIGHVKEVRADRQEDIFDGIIVDHATLIPGDEELITADRVDRIYERGVVLKPDAT